MPRQLSRFDRWPTGAKLLLLLTAVLLPLGLVLVWAADKSIRDLNAAQMLRAEQQGQTAAKAIESLIARNALAIRIATQGAFGRPDDPCVATARSLALTPAIGNRFVVRREDGSVICTQGGFQPRRNDMLTAPGDIRLWVSPLDNAVNYRVGVIGGMVTGALTVPELRATVAEMTGGLYELSISDGESGIVVLDDPLSHEGDQQARVRTYGIGGGDLQVRAVTAVPAITLAERLIIFLPLIIWGAATILSWLLVRRLLIKPLARLQRSIIAYQPGDEQLELPDRLGPAIEIRELGQAFVRAVDRIEQSERQMTEAFEGQRRLVREVHHRVKNNLQVVASLLNIHGRSAGTPEAGAAYAAIGRRVDALSVVHRNHFADVEENRGIALRPLLVELAATLRASAPDDARTTAIQLDVDALHTTQDAAVATAFFVTEVVEFAMLRRAGEPLEIELRRVSELAARLTIASEMLVGDETGEDPEREQFRRVVGGLARQLRSPLDEKLGRLSVDVPVFPD